VWDFPAPPDGERARTWGIYDSRVNPRVPAKSLKPALETALARAGRSLEATPLEGHPFRWYGWGAPLAAPHVLLVGDAAGADPLVGEGISFALGYGEVAATALADAFAEGEFAFGDYRHRVLRHRSGRYLRRRSMIAEAFYRIRSRTLLRTLWPLGVAAMDRWFVDWGDGG
jgi:flavin-dependent dehydrogenase